MDTSPEGRMVIRNLLLTTEEGLGNGETPIFPIQIFRVKEGVNYNPGEPNFKAFPELVDAQIQFPVQLVKKGVQVALGLNGLRRAFRAGSSGWTARSTASSPG